MSYQKWPSFVFEASEAMRRKVLRASLAGALVVLLPVLAGAYTLVLRDGRHLEIPAAFVVTQTTLTYERAPGFNVTLQLSIIDIPATERMNHQVPGSFLQRAETNASQPTIRTPLSRITITNVDLERSRRARLQSETAYEQRRRELGLPTIEETRRREQQQAEELRETLQEQRILRERNEAYWRARADELRTELAEINGQIAYLNARLAEMPETRVFATNVIAGVGALPFASTGRPFATNGWGAPAMHRGRIYVAPNRGNVSGQIGFGTNHFRGTVGLNRGFELHPFGHAQSGFGSLARVPFGLGYPAVLAAQPWAFDGSYERSALVEQLNNLLMTRAGLQARWRLLEDEARRDGAPPGWLRQ